MSKITAPESGTPQTHVEQLRTIAHLAGLLQRLESTPHAVHPDQYRTVVQALTGHFQSVENSADLRNLLRSAPAAAELYENLNYQSAGLCLHDLDRAIASEGMARDALEKIRRL